MTTAGDLAQLLRDLDADASEHLAHLLLEQAARKRRRLTEVLGRPGLGWHRRRRAPRAVLPRPTMTPAGVVNVVAGMVGDGYPELVAVEAVVDLAVETGLRQPIAEQAAARGVVMGRQRRRSDVAA